MFLLKDSISLLLLSLFEFGIQILKYGGKEKKQKFKIFMKYIALLLLCKWNLVWTDLFSPSAYFLHTTFKLSALPTAAILIFIFRL